MSLKASPTLIGAFVLGAIALAIIGLVLFGGGRYFTERVNYVAYFDESISGLAEGAPVNFRGVKVGSVSRIEVQLDAQDMSITIPVHIELERRRIREAGGTIPQHEVIPQLIKDGLCAQLQLQSILTGQLYIQLDFDTHGKAKFSQPDSPEPEMPTIPSSMQQLAQTLESLSIQDMVNQAQQVLTSVHQLVTSDNIEEILAGANRLVNSKDLVELVGSANQAVTEMRTLMTDVGGGFEHISSSLDSTLVEVRQTLESLQDAMSAAEQTLSIASEGSPVRHGLEQTLTEISAAARSIRVLAEYLENHPDSLIRGKLGRN